MVKNMDMEKTVEILGKYFKVEKCRGCECLQGFLVQLGLDKPELKGRVKGLMVSPSEMHKCLGCNPCPPAEKFTKYLMGKC